MFDDDHEMRRHLSGAVLMGAGGILAGGCTSSRSGPHRRIDAGAVAPLAVGGMVVGARLGISILVDGPPPSFNALQACSVRAGPSSNQGRR